MRASALVCTFYNIVTLCLQFVSPLVIICGSGVVCLVGVRAHVACVRACESVRIYCVYYKQKHKDAEALVIKQVSANRWRCKLYVIVVLNEV